MNAAWENILRSLGWTLVHFIWEGAVVAALLAIVLHIWRKAPSHQRYLISCLAMLLLILAPLATFDYFDRANLREVISTAREDDVPPTDSMTSARERAHPTDTVVVVAQRLAHKLNFQQRFDRFLPWVVVGWAAGVAALSFRLAAGCLLVNRLKRGAASALDPQWLDRLDDLKHRLGVSRPVRLVASALVEVPTVIGWLKPVILLPAGCVAGLSPAQLESILAHELAHIRRHDYLVNLLQSAVETLLFYHPAVWWVSRRIREERELCCDDLAVEICGDRACYARALATLEELRAPELALAANAPPLLRRIQRLAGKSDARSGRVFWPVMAIVVVLLLGAGLLGFEWHHHRAASRAHKKAPMMASSPLRFPPLENMTMQTFMIDAEKFPQPLAGMLHDIRTFSLRNTPLISIRTTPSGSQPAPAINAMWSIMRTDGSVAPPFAPSEKDIQFEDELLKFFSDRDVHFETNDEANATKSLIYSTSAYNSMLSVRATPEDLLRITDALHQMDALVDPTKAVPSAMAPPAQGLRLPSPPSRTARTAAANPDIPAEVTAAVLAVQQAAARANRPFPPIPTPAAPPPPSAIDPLTGLPVTPGATNQQPMVIDPATGLLVSATSRRATPSSGIFDPATGQPFPAAPAQTNRESLDAQAFQVDMAQFSAGYKRLTGQALDETNPAGQMRQLLISKGVRFSASFPANAGRAIIFDNRTDTFVLAAPMSEMRIIKDTFSQMGGSWDKTKSPNTTNAPPSSSATAPTTTKTISRGRQAIFDKLNSIHVDLNYDASPLSDVINDLSGKIRDLDSNKVGINLFIDREIPLLANGEADISTATVTLKLQNARLSDALAAITKAASKPIKFSVLDYGIMFSKRGNETSSMDTRVFHVQWVDLRQFLNQSFPEANLSADISENPDAFQLAVKRYFASLGVDFMTANDPAGKAFAYGDRKGLLMVRATPEDLDKIGAALEKLTAPSSENSTPKVKTRDARGILHHQIDLEPVRNENHVSAEYVADSHSPAHPPEIDIKVKIVEIDEAKSSIKSLDDFWDGKLRDYETNEMQVPSRIIEYRADGTNTIYLTNNASVQGVGILNAPDFKIALEKLEQKKGVNELSAPQVITLSGQQAQIQIGDVITWPREKQTSPRAKDINISIGTTVDLWGKVSENRDDIEITAKPTISQLGAPSTDVPIAVSMVAMSAKHTVHNGDTLVLTGLAFDEPTTGKVPLLGAMPLLNHPFRSGSTSKPGKQLLVFITPTLINPDGTPVK